LLSKNCIFDILNNKHIKIKFNAKGNSHVVNDYLRGLSGFDKQEMMILDKLLKDALYIRSTEKIKDRKDKIQRFYYFKDKDREIYYNVAEEVRELRNGKVRLDRFLYAITKSIKEK
jgi:hypothetical protein